MELPTGQIVYLRGSGECGINVAYQLVSPSGVALDRRAVRVQRQWAACVAPQSGTYTVSVSSWDGGTGPYDIEVVPVPADDTTSVTVGSSVVGELTVPGERDLYTFPATAGDAVFLAGFGACGANVEYAVVSPSGVELAGAQYVSADLGHVDLPQSGEYTVAVRSWNGGVGAYDLDLSAVPDDSFTEVAVGDTLLGEIGAAGKQRVFTFTTEASDVVVLDGVGACVNVDYTLYSPSGVELTGAPYVCNDTGEIELPESGTYEIVVASWDGGTGPYEIDLLAG